MSTTVRTIKIKMLDREQIVNIETAARTLGDFKQEAEVQKLDIDWGKIKMIDRLSKTSFELDEAVLPATDAIFFCFLTQTKSGADLPYKEAKAAIKELKEKGVTIPFNYTQATTAQLNAFLNLQKKSKETNTTKKVEPVSTIPSTPNRVQEVVSDAVITITNKDLTEEGKKIQEIFKKK